jgi:capsular polysaccharide biosynthesis protein
VPAHQKQPCLEEVVKKFNLASDKKGEMERMIHVLKSRITVAPIENTKIIKITVRWDNPDMAVKAANAVANAYMSFTYGEQQKSYDEVYNLQDEQVKLAKQKLKESDELAMRSINEKVYLMMLEMREDTRLNKAMSTREIQLLEPAFEAVFRGTRKGLKVFLGGLIGFVLGVGTVLMKEYLATPLWPERQK